MKRINKDRSATAIELNFGKSIYKSILRSLIRVIFGKSIEFKCKIKVNFINLKGLLRKIA